MTFIQEIMYVESSLSLFSPLEHIHYSNYCLSNFFPLLFGARERLIYESKLNA